MNKGNVPHWKWSRPAVRLSDIGPKAGKFETKTTIYNHISVKGCNHSKHHHKQKRHQTNNFDNTRDLEQAQNDQHGGQNIETVRKKATTFT